MQRQFLATLAVLLGTAACRGATAEQYVPHGRFPASVPVGQALSECRLQIEDAERRRSPATAPGTPRQIPPPMGPRPGLATMEACMEAKGYRRSR